MSTVEQLEATILVVEDDPDVAELLAESLQLAGYRVVVAHDGVAALQQLEGPALPDLILLDLGMPVMNGYEFVRHLRGNPVLSKIPVLLCTGEPSNRLGRVAADGYVPKPLNMEVVLAAVGRWCAAGRKVRAS